MSLRVDSKAIPPHIRRLMPAEALAGNVEAMVAGMRDPQDEAELQDQCLRILEAVGAWFFWQRMDRPTRGPIGTPDILFVYRGRFCAWECKHGSNTPTDAQFEALEAISRNGGAIAVIRDTDRALEFLRNVAGVAS